MWTFRMIPFVLQIVEVQKFIIIIFNNTQNCNNNYNIIITEHYIVIYVPLQVCSFQIALKISKQVIQIKSDYFHCTIIEYSIMQDYIIIITVLKCIFNCW